MQYRPNFCCECGGKIDRIEWQPWTSRRFCDVCLSAHRFSEWKSIGFFVAGIVFLIFGAAFYLNSHNSSAFNETKKLSTQNVTFASNSQLKGNANLTSSRDPNDLAVSANSTALSNKEKFTPDAPPAAKTVAKTQSVQTANAGAEKIYFCGAQTKKGTPCSRRVKGGGRCWQHQGMPAMLSEKELAINP